MDEGRGNRDDLERTEETDIWYLINTTNNIIEVVEQLKVELIYLSGRGVTKVPLILPSKKSPNFFDSQCDETFNEFKDGGRQFPPSEIFMKPAIGGLFPGQCDEEVDESDTQRPRFWRGQCDELTDDGVPWICRNLWELVWWLRVICRNVALSKQALPIGRDD